MRDMTDGPERRNRSMGMDQTSIRPSALTSTPSS
ncbi:hypothetical protein GXY_00044 [Novacetimonas hansenii ATCC 23769]|uniref:Uncharacterized protein n=1 Tax=Novacetimonas hansenii ATCC 23769 TaxID=714995 RepID=D5QA74_NOVHA|nr:hypothetical protein GXY_00044 [Novacetimonas hansenii ATCC 23769]